MKRWMKTLLPFAIVALVSAGLTAVVMAGVNAPNGLYEGQPVVKVVVNGKEVQSAVPGIIFNGSTLVPLRAIGEAAGFKVAFDVPTYTASLEATEPSSTASAPAPTSTSTSTATGGSSTPPATSTTIGQAPGTGATTGQITSYLQANFGTVVTPMGTLALTYRVQDNDVNALSWDTSVDMDYGNSMIFYDFVLKIGISQADKDATDKAFRDHARKVYDIVHAAKPGKKIFGAYFHSWYEYPSIQVGYKSRRWYSWNNYVMDYGDFTKSIYDSAVLSDFHFDPSWDK